MVSKKSLFCALGLGFATLTRAAYLTNLSFNNDCLVGATSAIGTISLNATSASPVTVNLTSNSPYLSVPTSITIPANWPINKWTFTATSSIVTATTVVRVVAKYGDRWQVSNVTLVPNSGSFAIQNASARAGAGMVRVRWKKLLEESFGTTLKGYRISRTDAVDGTVVLNGTPVIADEFLDRNVVPNRVYSYTVQLVDSANTIKGSSPSVNATPMADNPLPWRVAPPSTTVSDKMSFSVRTPGGLINPTAQVYVDGQKYGSIIRDSMDRSSTKTDLVGAVDTTELGNGPHTLAVVLDTDNPRSTQFVNFQCQNDVCRVKVEDVADVFVAEGASISFRYGGSNVYISPGPDWIIQAMDGEGNLVREWSGQGSDAKLAWNGKNALEQILLMDEYRVRIKYGLNGSYNDWSPWKPITVTQGSPNYLALVSITEKDNPTITIDYAQELKERLFNRSQSYWSFKPLVLTRYHKKDYGPPFGPEKDGRIYASEKLRLRIRLWLESTVKDFYYYGHGSFGTTNSGVHVGNFQWGGLNFYSYQAYESGGVPSDTVFPAEYLSVPGLFGSGRGDFNTVFLDMCFSAGLDTTPSYLWRDAFQIYAPEEQSFIGFRGDSYLNTDGNGNASNWHSWRSAFWYYVCSGYYISQAQTLANQDITGPGPNITPATSNKTQIYGNEQIPETE